jgi:hypothetical protein
MGFSIKLLFIMIMLGVDMYSAPNLKSELLVFLAFLSVCALLKYGLNLTKRQTGHQGAQP